LKPNDFKLHHFFALHRPLLLHSQPTSTIFETPSPNLITHKPSPPGIATALSSLDDPPESSQDADADAARQLVHSMVMNRVGGQVEWERTLQHLGLHDEPRRDRMEAALQGLEGVMVEMDSTRRKKRKKMNKHRYKKRRRATRSQRRKLDN